MPLPALAGAALVYMRFSMLPEIQTMAMGFNLYLLYFVAIPALFAVVIAGGIPRTFRGRPAYCWVGYGIWLILGIPFSTWSGDSAHVVSEFIRADLPMLFVIGGLAVNWKLTRWMMYAIAFGGLTNVVAARFFMADPDGRMGLSLGTVGNPNDFAAHLLVVTPFVLWLALNSKFVPLRLAAVIAIGVSLYYMLATGSRGAVVSLIVDGLFFLWKGNMKQRIGILVLAPIAAIVLLTVMNQSILVRLGSFSSSSATASAEALDSSQAREYLFSKSIEYTLSHPLFGVGANQFGLYEGYHNKVLGTHGAFHGTHNTFTQASAECGIPAALFMIAGVLTTFALFNSILKEARKRLDCADIQSAAFCAMLGLAGFTVAVTFLNFAYSFYLPAMGGLAVAMKAAANAEFRKRQVSSNTLVQNPQLYPEALGSRRALADRIRTARNVASSY